MAAANVAGEPFFHPRDFFEPPLSMIRNFKREFGAFTQLFFDNLSTMVGVLGALMGNFGQYGAGVPGSTLYQVVYGKMASGLGLAMLWGNIYYAWQGARETRLKGRQFTAQPYGVNTPAAFAFVFLIMIPVYYSELAGGTDEDKAAAFTSAYNVAVAANFVVGILNVFASFFGPWIVRTLPPAALLVPIAGIGFTFLGLQQITGNFGQPIVGFLPLLFVFVGWYSNIKLFGILPEAFTVIAIGTILAWIDPITRGEYGANTFGLSEKVKIAGGIVNDFVPDPNSFENVGEGFKLLGTYIGTVIPVAISASALTLMCLLSARNAGDPYPIAETMIIDGLGTCIAALLGCPFGTVVYIGHPAHKRNGATCGYSWLNGLCYFIIGMSGLFAIFEAVFPIQAIGPIILFVGLMICEDAVASLPQRHWGVFLFGLYPSICNFMTNGVVALAANGSAAATWGVFAMKKGDMLVSFVWCGILSYTVDRVWWKMVIWALLGSLFSVFGIIHQNASGTERIRGGVTGAYDPSQGRDQLCYYQTTDPDALFYVEQGTWPNNPRECGTIQWRFCVAYIMIAVVGLVFEIAQRMGFGPKSVHEDGDDFDFQKDWYNVEHHDITHLKHDEVDRSVQFAGGHHKKPDVETGVEEKAPSSSMPSNHGPPLFSTNGSQSGPVFMQPQMFHPQQPIMARTNAPFPSMPYPPQQGGYQGGYPSMGMPMQPPYGTPQY